VANVSKLFQHNLCRYQHNYGQNLRRFAFNELNYDEKKFYDVDTCGQYDKTFFGIIYAGIGIATFKISRNTPILNLITTKQSFMMLTLVE
jgi:hypothetical protein